jgi:hypothetical protein
MLEQLFATLHKASEGTMFAQREMMKQWAQGWPAMPPMAAQAPSEQTRALQKRWVESATESLNMQRDLVDSACRAGVEIVQKAAHLSDAKSPEDYMHSLQELLAKMFDVAKTQSEAQLRHFAKVSQAWRETPQAPQTPQAG